MQNASAEVREAMSKIIAPWSPNQIHELNRFQRAGVMHPFTCPNRNDGNHGEYVLFAAFEGWICPYCTYTQDWAWAMMAESGANQMLFLGAARVERACEVMHDAYEKAATGAGWETNPASRKPWDEVPEENKMTMRVAVAALMDWLGFPE